MEASWTGRVSYERSVGVERPIPQEDFSLPAGLLEELTDSFTFFDRNGDGQICKGELGTVLRALGGTEKVSDEQIEQLVHDVDVNGDGFLDLYEFIELNMKIKDVDDSKCLSRAFHVFDVDRDGFISPEELHHVLEEFGDMSADECRCLIQAADEDGDEMVDFQEFQALMNHGSLSTFVQ